MAAAAEPRSWFAVPAPVRHLFQRFPLHTYDPEPLPLGAPDIHDRPSLYVFAGDDDARAGRPSYNPACLKAQTILRIAGVDVDIVPSNNHASPSGALPFLLSPTSAKGTSVPLTGEKIVRYAREHASLPLGSFSPRPKIEAYQALLTQNIRPAWLHALYLLPANDDLLKKLYLSPTPSSGALHRPLRSTLHAAATEQILTTTRRPHLSPTQLRVDLSAGLSALSALLDGNDWFFGEETPGLFDAEVFAYTFLILDARMQWRDDRLAECLSEFGNLIEHRRRLYERCWGDGPS